MSEADLYDQYFQQAKDEVNRAWAYRDDEGVIERDQAKWLYAVHERAGRLRAEAALLSLSNCLHSLFDTSLPALTRLQQALQAAKDTLELKDVIQ